jgi:hypothetical protein
MSLRYARAVEPTVTSSLGGFGGRAVSAVCMPTVERVAGGTRTDKMRARQIIHHGRVAASLRLVAS